MKDKRIWPFKRRAEEDNLITAGACRLILRLASWRYCTRHHPADAEFSLSWRHMAAWYDNEGPEVIKNKRTIYRWLRELVHNRYLHYNGRKGCPAQSCYRLDLDHKPEALTLFNWAAEKASEIVILEAQKNAPTVVRKTARQDGHKTPPPILRYSLWEEMNNTKGKKLRSLRSKTTTGKRLARFARKERPNLPLCDGQDASAVPNHGRAQKSPAEDKALSSHDNLSAAGERAGQVPPARGGKTSPRSLSTESQRIMDLHKARFYVTTHATNHLNDHLVSLLVEAGDTLPPEVTEKFAKHKPEAKL